MESRRELLRRSSRLAGAVFGALLPTIAAAQHTVSFNPSAAGLTRSVATWGVDTAWPSFDNVRLSVANIGQVNVDSVRVTFEPSEPLTDNGNGTYSLSAAARSLLDSQLSLANQAGSKPITLVAGAYPTTFDAVNWTRTIKATQEYINSKAGFTTRQISSIEAFNEPDWWGGNGASAGTASQLNSIITTLKTYAVFQNTQFPAASTLSSGAARGWYDQVPAATQGSSHLLGGSLTSYVNFISHVQQTGKQFVNPELHSLGEAIIGADRGMVSGTFWADVLRARGLFVQASDGKRLGYAEDLGRQSAAAVYRSPDDKVRLFAGGVERTGSKTSYRFVSDRDVYINGIPTREYVLQTDMDRNASSTDNDFQNYGSWSNQGAYADVETTPTLPALDGYRWKIVNVGNGQVMEVRNSGTSDGATIRIAADAGGLNQQWNISRTRNGYFELYNVNSGRTAEVANGSLSNGASVRQWGTADNSIQQWFIEDAGGGAFYLRNAFTTKYMVGGTNNNTQNDLLTSPYLKWRFVLSNPNAPAKAKYAFQNNVSDSSANGHHATAFNGPTYGAGPSGVATAINLDGANDYVQLPAAVASSENLTVSTWVKWNGGNAWQRIFDFGSSTSSYMFLTPNSGAGTMRFAINRGEGEEMIETAALPTGQWVHLTLTLGGNTGILYVNGKPQVAGQVLLDSANLTTTLNYIGKSQFGSDPTFSGSIADFRVYDYALHLSQVPSLIYQCWTGSAGTSWTTAAVASPKNWLFDLNAADYTDGVGVLFNDYATGFNVNVSDAAVMPAGVQFTNALYDYTLGGTGAIAGSGVLTKTGGAALTINNANTYTGGTVLSAGRLNINHASAIGTGRLTIGAGTTIDNTSGAAVTLSTDNLQTWDGDFTFGGTNALDLGAGAVTLSGSRTVTTQGTETLTVGPIAQSGGTRSLTKAGAGTLELTGAASYTGGTTILDGTLIVGSPAFSGFLGASVVGTDIRGGQLVFDFSGDTSPASIVLSILDAGYDQSTRFSAGRLRDTALPADWLLGWVEDVSGQTVTIRPTRAGDVNLDLSVNFNDLLLLAKSYGASGTWGQGDADYDGTVGFNDLLALARNYGTTSAASFAADWALAQALTPEPTALLAVLGLVKGRRNRSR